MTYAAGEARQELLDTIGVAVDALARSLADLGVAYELLDERTADRLEEDLFGPVQRAYGRAQRTYTGFAQRFALTTREFATATDPSPGRGVKELVQAAVTEVDRADLTLSELQDSMRPVEVGDQELRAGLADVRERLGAVRGAARELLRTFGR